MAILKTRTTKPSKPRLMSHAEICRRFPSSWVLIADPVVDDSMTLMRGRVAYHGADADEVTRMIRVLGLKGSMVLFTGRIPEKTAFL